MKAPTITLYTAVRNPDLMQHGGSQPYFIHTDVEAEVLSVHFNTKKVRLRYKDPLGKIIVCTMHLDIFSRKYKIVVDS